jgi:hypothetical protein
MFTNQQRAINFMNNKAAISLAMGQEREAIASLRDAFDLLAGACEARDSKEDTDSMDVGIEDDTTRTHAYETDYKRHVYPLSNLKEKCPSERSCSNSFFVFDKCFVLEEDDFDEEHEDKDDDICDQEINPESRRMAIKSAATIYNMALAYHRLALASPDCKHRGAWTYKATTFYKQALGLVVSDLRQDSECPQHQHNDASVIALAAYNNMGQICFDLLSDNEWAKGCFKAFAHIVRYSPYVSDSMHHDLELRSDNAEDCMFFSKSDWDGLLSNLIFVDMMTGSVAAAA